MSKRMMKAIKYTKPEDKRTKDGENDKVECSKGIDAKRSSSIQYLQNLTHPLFYGVSKIIGSFCHGKPDVIPDAFKRSLIRNIFTRMCIFIPFALITFS